MKQVTKRNVLVVACLSWGLCHVLGASAGDWEFGAEVYLWGASIGGKSSSSSNIDIDFDDLFDNLELAFMGTAAARKDSWMLVTDVIYMDVKASDTISSVDTSVELTAWIVTPMVGYALVDSDRGTLWALAGARYLYLDGDLKLGPLEGDDSGDVWDGVIGLRGSLNLSDKVYLSGHLDIGTGDTKRSWQGLAGIGYRFDRFDLVAGYRYLDFDFDNNDVFDDLNLGGPMAGMKFYF